MSFDNLARGPEGLGSRSDVNKTTSSQNTLRTQLNRPVKMESEDLSSSGIEDEGSVDLLVTSHPHKPSLFSFGSHGSGVARRASEYRVSTVCDLHTDDSLTDLTDEVKRVELLLNKKKSSLSRRRPIEARQSSSFSGTDVEHEHESDDQALSDSEAEALLKHPEVDELVRSTSLVIRRMSTSKTNRADFSSSLVITKREESEGCDADDISLSLVSKCMLDPSPPSPSNDPSQPLVVHSGFPIGDTSLSDTAASARETLEQDFSVLTLTYPASRDDSRDNSQVELSSFLSVPSRNAEESKHPGLDDTDGHSDSQPERISTDVDSRACVISKPCPKIPQLGRIQSSSVDPSSSTDFLDVGRIQSSSVDPSSLTNILKVGRIQSSSIDPSSLTNIPQIGRIHSSSIDPSSSTDFLKVGRIQSSSVDPSSSTDFLKVGRIQSSSVDPSSSTDFLKVCRIQSSSVDPSSSTDFLNVGRIQSSSIDPSSLTNIPQVGRIQSSSVDPSSSTDFLKVGRIQSSSVDPSSSTVFLKVGRIQSSSVDPSSSTDFLNVGRIQSSSIDPSSLTNIPQVGRIQSSSVDPSSSTDFLKVGRIQSSSVDPSSSTVFLKVGRIQSSSVDPSSSTDFLKVGRIQSSSVDPSSSTDFLKVGRIQSSSVDPSSSTDFLNVGRIQSSSIDPSSLTNIPQVGRIQSSSVDPSSSTDFLKVGRIQSSSVDPSSSTVFLKVGRIQSSSVDPSSSTDFLKVGRIQSSSVDPSSSTDFLKVGRIQSSSVDPSSSTDFLKVGRIQSSSVDPSSSTNILMTDQIQNSLDNPSSLPDILQAGGIPPADLPSVTIVTPNTGTENSQTEWDNVDGTLDSFFVSTDLDEHSLTFWVPRAEPSSESIEFCPTSETDLPEYFPETDSTPEKNYECLSGENNILHDSGIPELITPSSTELRSDESHYDPENASFTTEPKLIPMTSSTPIKNVHLGHGSVDSQDITCNISANLQDPEGHNVSADVGKTVQKSLKSGSVASSQEFAPLGCSSASDPSECFSNKPGHSSLMSLSGGPPSGYFMPYADQPEKRILEHSSAELAAILKATSFGQMPLRKASPNVSETEGRKVSFNKMMDSAPSFRPVFEFGSEAGYSGQNTFAQSLRSNLLQNNSIQGASATQVESREMETWSDGHPLASTSSDLITIAADPPQFEITLAIPAPEITLIKKVEIPFQEASTRPESLGQSEEDLLHFSEISTTVTHSQDLTSDANATSDMKKKSSNVRFSENVTVETFSYSAPLKRFQSREECLHTNSDESSSSKGGRWSSDSSFQAASWLLKERVESNQPLCVADDHQSSDSFHDLQNPESQAPSSLQYHSLSDSEVESVISIGSASEGESVVSTGSIHNGENVEQIVDYAMCPGQSSNSSGASEFYSRHLIECDNPNISSASADSYVDWNTRDKRTSLIIWKLIIRVFSKDSVEKARSKVVDLVTPEEEELFTALLILAEAILDRLREGKRGINSAITDVAMFATLVEELRKYAKSLQELVGHVQSSSKDLDGNVYERDNYKWEWTQGVPDLTLCDVWKILLLLLREEIKEDDNSSVESFVDSTVPSKCDKAVVGGSSENVMDLMAASPDQSASPTVHEALSFEDIDLTDKRDEENTEAEEEKLPTVSVLFQMHLGHCQKSDQDTTNTIVDQRSTDDMAVPKISSSDNMASHTTPGITEANQATVDKVEIVNLPGSDEYLASNSTTRQSSQAVRKNLGSKPKTSSHLSTKDSLPVFTTPSELLKWRQSRKVPAFGSKKDDSVASLPERSVPDSQKGSGTTDSDSSKRLHSVSSLPDFVSPRHVLKYRYQQKVNVAASKEGTSSCSLPDDHSPTAVPETLKGSSLPPSLKPSNKVQIQDSAHVDDQHLSSVSTFTPPSDSVVDTSKQDDVTILIDEQSLSSSAQESRRSILAIPTRPTCLHLPASRIQASSLETQPEIYVQTNYGKIDSMLSDTAIQQLSGQILSPPSTGVTQELHVGNTLEGEDGCSFENERSTSENTKDIGPLPQGPDLFSETSDDTGTSQVLSAMVEGTRMEDSSRTLLFPQRPDSESVPLPLKPDLLSDLILQQQQQKLTGQDDYVAASTFPCSLEKDVPVGTSCDARNQLDSSQLMPSLASYQGSDSQEDSYTSLVVQCNSSQSIPSSVSRLQHQLDLTTDNLGLIPSLLEQSPVRDPFDSAPRAQEMTECSIRRSSQAFHDGTEDEANHKEAEQSIPHVADTPAPVSNVELPSHRSISSQQRFLQSPDNLEETHIQDGLRTLASNLSIVGHLATSEVLQRDYRLDSMEDSGLMIPSGDCQSSAVYRSQRPQEVSSDYTDYYLRSRFNLPTTDETHSQSDPHCTAPFSPNTSSESQWTFGSLFNVDSEASSVDGMQRETMAFSIGDTIPAMPQDSEDSIIFVLIPRIDSFENNITDLEENVVNAVVQTSTDSLLPWTSDEGVARTEHETSSATGTESNLSLQVISDGNAPSTSSGIDRRCTFTVLASSTTDHSNVFTLSNINLDRSTDASTLANADVDRRTTSTLSSNNVDHRAAAAILIPSGVACKADTSTLTNSGMDHATTSSSSSSDTDHRTTSTTSSRTDSDHTTTSSSALSTSGAVPTSGPSTSTSTDAERRTSSSTYSTGTERNNSPSQSYIDRSSRYAQLRRDPSGFTDQTNMDAILVQSMQGDRRTQPFIIGSEKDFHLRSGPSGCSDKDSTPEKDRRAEGGIVNSYQNLSGVVESHGFRRSPVGASSSSDTAWVREEENGLPVHRHLGSSFTMTENPSYHANEDAPDIDSNPTEVPGQNSAAKPDPSHPTNEAFWEHYLSQFQQTHPNFQPIYPESMSAKVAHWGSQSPVVTQTPPSIAQGVEPDILEERVSDTAAVVVMDVLHLDGGMDDNQLQNTSRLPQEVQEVQASSRLRQEVQEVQASSRLPQEVQEVQTSSRLPQEVQEVQTSSRLPQEVQEVQATSRLLQEVQEVQASSRLLQEVQASSRLPQEVQEVQTSSRLPQEVQEIQTSSRLPQEVQEVQASSRLPQEVQEVQASSRLPQEVQEVQTSSRLPQEVQEVQASSRLPQEVQEVQATSRLPQEVQEVQASSRLPQEVQEVQASSRLPQEVQEVQTSSRLPQEVQEVQTSSRLPQEVQEVQATSRLPQEVQEIQTSSRLPQEVQEVQTSSRLPQEVQKVQATSRLPQEVQKVQASSRLPQEVQEVQTSSRLPREVQEVQASSRLPQEVQEVQTSSRLPQEVQEVQASSRLPQEVQEVLCRSQCVEVQACETYGDTSQETEEEPSDDNDSPSDRCTSSPLNGDQGESIEGTTGKRRTIPVLTSGYKMANQDVRTFLIEKEMLESQCRKLQVENSSLQTENKQLKNKYNKSNARVTDLQEQVSRGQQQLIVVKDRVNQEISEAIRKNKSSTELQMDTLQKSIIVLSAENKNLKAELVSADKQLIVAKQTAEGNSGEQSVAAHKSEISTLKTELSDVKELLQQSTEELHELQEQKQLADNKLVKLTEVKNLLQHQTETTGQSAAEKMVKSLEKRLHVTEQRFFQERSDRANNLSEVEEKLLTENAKLLASEKELARQLQRAKDRVRNLELKVKDSREENMNLRLALPLGSNVPSSSRKGSYDLPHSIHSTIRMESKMMMSDVKEIMMHVQRDTGLSPGQEVDMVCELWRRNEVSSRKLLEWDQELFDLKINNGNITQGLKNLREMKSQYEEKVRQMEEEAEDILNEKNTLETTYKQQVSELVRERHEALAKLKTLEDLMTALRAENDTLRNNLSVMVDRTDLTEDLENYKAQLELMSTEKHSMEMQLKELNRTTRLQQGELQTLQSQLLARETSLDELVRDMEHSSNRREEEELTKRRRAEHLHSQVVNLQAEVKIWQQKYEGVCEEKAVMEEQLDVANRELSLAKVHSMENVEKKRADLEVELEEKESELFKLTAQYNHVEEELQQTKHNLILEAEQRVDLEAHVESLEGQLEQKQRLMDSLSQSGQEQVKYHQGIKDTLDNITLELRNKQAAVKRLQVELSQEKDRNEKLQETLQQTQSPNGRESSQSGEITAEPLLQKSSTTPAMAEVRLRDLQTEREKIKTELVQAHSSVESLTEEVGELRAQMQAARQEFIKERDTVCQLIADKSDTEQNLQSCIEERDEIYREKQQAESDLSKLEENFHALITKFDLESRQRLGNFQLDHTNLGPDGQQMEEELRAIRLLLGGKDAEISMIRERMSRQAQELDYCRRKVDILHQENQCHREDISRQTTEIAQKMKEITATMEVNQLLVSERSRLQKDLYQLQNELDREKEYREQRHDEVTDILKKFDQSTNSQKSTERELHQLDNKIVALEADLRHANRMIGQLQTENQQAKVKVENLNEDIRSLTNINVTLEKRLETEKSTVAEDKQTVIRLREEVSALSQQLEFLKHEKAMLRTNLDSERKTADKLKDQIVEQDEERNKLREEVQMVRLELDTQMGQLLASREGFEQTRKEKQNIYADYQELCKKLNDKEKALTEAQEKFNVTIENIQRDFNLERTTMEKDRAAVEKDLEYAKDEVSELSEKLSQKDVQLSTFGRTLQEMEDLTRQNREQETKIQKMESGEEDSRILIGSHRAEIMSLRQTNKEQEEKFNKLETTHKSLETELKDQKESYTEQVHELKQSMAEMKNTYEMGKFELKEKLTKAEATLETTQANLETLHQSYSEHQQNNKTTESSVHELRSQVQRETTEKQLAERKMISLENNVEEAKRKYETLHERLVQAETLQLRAEQELVTEREKFKKLEKEFTDLEAASYVHESGSQAKQEQLDLLQAELSKLRQLSEAQRQQLAGKYKKAALEFKQNTDIYESEKKHLISQTEQLTVDLEQAREQVTLKNKENLKLQEEMLVTESQFREASSKLRRAEDTLHHEEEVQTKLIARNHEQEEELKKMRTFVSRKADEEGHIEGKMTWNEVNRSMQDLSQKMQHHFQSEKDIKDRETKTAYRYKKHIAELETELHMEKALHQITRNSLTASEEDCQRLRSQLRSSRLRTTSADEKSQKSRMERINEIIAKSQTQAQVLLASGAYYDFSPSRDISLSTPRSAHHSPDNSLAEQPTLLNTSFNNAPLSGSMFATSSPPHKNNGPFP